MFARRGLVNLIARHERIAGRCKVKAVAIPNRKTAFKRMFPLLTGGCAVLYLTWPVAAECAKGDSDDKNGISFPGASNPDAISGILDKYSDQVYHKI